MESLGSSFLCLWCVCERNRKEPSNNNNNNNNRLYDRYSIRKKYIERETGHIHKQIIICFGFSIVKRFARNFAAEVFRNAGHGCNNHIPHPPIKISKRAQDDDDDGGEAGMNTLREEKKKM